jgi:GNAT superfamily N-acetyltransferase
LPPAEPIIRALRADDRLNALSMGDAEFTPLKTFLKRDAHDYERESVARTYVVVDPEDAERGGRVWGYVSLVASEVHLGSAHRPAVTRWPDGYSMPAVKLARMALDQELRGQGIGRTLLDWVIALVKDHIACRIGCRLLVTDSKQGAIKFYERMGFTMLDTPENKGRQAPVMFIVIGKLDRVSTIQPTAPPVDHAEHAPQAAPPINEAPEP